MVQNIVISEMVQPEIYVSNYSTMCTIQCIKVSLHNTTVLHVVLKYNSTNFFYVLTWIFILQSTYLMIDKPQVLMDTLSFRFEAFTNHISE